MSKSLRRKLVIGLAVLTAAGIASCAPPKPAKTVIRFSLLSADSQQEVRRYWQPVLDDLAKSTGYEVQPFFSANYGLLIEAMSAKQTEVGWFSALPAVEAVDRAGAEVFARTVDDKGRDYYTSVVLAKKGSGLTLDKLLKCDKSLNFGIGDANSTSGTLAPMTFLFNAKGIDPRACFKTVRSAEHSVNLMAVANGVVDAATNNSTGMTYYKTGSPAAQEAVSKVDVIWESPPIPESAIVYRKDLDPEVQKKVRQFFVTYGKGEGPEADRQRAVLAKLKYSAFRPAQDAYLEPIRKMKNEQKAAQKADAAKPAAH
jgi:phosphonate transport system substrate-binding protein